MNERNPSSDSNTPLTRVGTLGYYLDLLDKLYYIRARYERPDLARWLTVDPLLLLAVPEVSAYGYGRQAPILIIDASGLQPKRKSCNWVADCLNQYPNPHKCEFASSSELNSTIAQALCLFWQESNMGSHPGAGGIGRCTKACYDELIRKGCSWLKREFPSYEDFVKNADDCTKVQAAHNFLVLVGLPGYGPGKGRPGDYRGPTGDRIRACEESIKCWSMLPIQGGLEGACDQCLPMVHK